MFLARILNRFVLTPLTPLRNRVENEKKKIAVLFLIKLSFKFIKNLSRFIGENVLFKKNLIIRL